MEVLGGVWASSGKDMVVSINELPKLAGWFISWNIKNLEMDDIGVPLFQECTWDVSESGMCPPVLAVSIGKMLIKQLISGCFLAFFLSNPLLTQQIGIENQKRSEQVKLMDSMHRIARQRSLRCPRMWRPSPHRCGRF